MVIKVVMAGATGWVGRAMIPAILAQGDMALTGAVARNAAGLDSGTALGLAPNGVSVSATLDEAMVAPSDVIVDYTKPDVVKRNTLAAIDKGRHVVIGTSGLGAADYTEIDKAAKAKGVGVLAAGNFSMLRRRVPSGVKGRRVSIISRMCSNCSATSKSAWSQA